LSSRKAERSEVYPGSRIRSDLSAPGFRVKPGTTMFFCYPGIASAASDIRDPRSDPRHLPRSSRRRGLNCFRPRRRDRRGDVRRPRAAEPPTALAGCGATQLGRRTQAAAAALFPRFLWRDRETGPGVPGGLEVPRLEKTGSGEMGFPRLKKVRRELRPPAKRCLGPHLR